MSSIDLVILGIVLEKPQSAYDIQKDVEYHHFSRWTKISVPSIYRKVLQLSEKGYLQSDIVKGDKFADKAIYSITDQGRAYFKELMASYAAGPVPLLFDFNVVITNLNKMDKTEALELVSALRRSIQSSAESNEGYAREFADIPLVGRTIFEQQQLQAEVENQQFTRTFLPPTDQTIAEFLLDFVSLYGEKRWGVSARCGYPRP